MKTIFKINNPTYSGGASNIRDLVFRYENGSLINITDDELQTLITYYENSIQAIGYMGPHYDMICSYMNQRYYQLCSYARARMRKD